MDGPIVYSEFLIHPLVLLSTSTKLRTEVKQTLQVLKSKKEIFSKVRTFFSLKIINFIPVLQAHKNDSDGSAWVNFDPTHF